MRVAVTRRRRRSHSHTSKSHTTLELLFSFELLVWLSPLEALLHTKRVDFVRRQGREVDALELLALIVLDNQMRLLARLKINNQTFVAVSVARLLDELFYLSQFV